MVEKTIELTGTSANTIEDAVNLAIARAAVTIQSIRFVRILDVIGIVENNAVSQWRVKMALSFNVEDRLHE
jgi:flavin-binding protein dodecin